MKPSLSILIPSYNSEQTIKRTLDSILNQKTNYHYKIITSDDASTDESIKVIEKYRKKHRDKIKLIKQKKNLKVCKNAIQLYKQIDSEYFCTLDSDDYWLRDDKIEKALNFLEKNKNYTSYQGKTLVKKPNEDYIYVDYPIDHTCMFLSLLTTNERNKIAQNKTLTKNDLELMKLPMSYPTMGHTSSSIFRNCLNSYMHIFDNATEDDIYGGDSFRNFVHLMHGFSYHSTDIDSVYNMHGNGVFSSIDNDLLHYRLAHLWYQFWEFSNRQFILLLATSFDCYLKVEQKLNTIAYKQTDNPRRRIPIMQKSYNENYNKLAEFYSVSELFKNSIKISKVG